MTSRLSAPDLLYFESIDLANQRFKEQHSRSLGAAKGREITSHFRQGREFFETASGAPPLVKPLLLYYGVLSWTRGLILFRDPRLRENSLQKKHGLSAHDWQGTLGNGMRHVGDLAVRIESGTFPTLTAVTQNVEGYFAGRWNSLLERGAKEVVAGTLVTAREVWSRMPALAEVYEETYQEPSYVYYDLGEIEGPPGTTIALRPFSTHAVPIEPEELHMRLQLPEDVRVCRNSWAKGYDYWLGRPYDILPDWAETLWGHEKVIVAPLQGNLRFSRLSLLFLNAYILGMLVRYHPTQWADLVHRGTGDVALPLIREATAALELEFPTALADGLRTPAKWLAHQCPDEPVEPG